MEPEALGKLIRPKSNASSSGSTGSPIYPTTGWMKRQLAKHGFGDMVVHRLPGSEAAIIAKRK